jgi:hypothetical protein
MGELLLQDDDIQAASREAVGPHTLRLALGAFALALIASGVVWNLFAGASRISTLTSALALPLLLLSLEIARRERARKLRQIAEALKQQGDALRYGLDDRGLTISGETAPVRLDWRGCLGYEEGVHTFALYFDHQLPQLVIKRAFGTQDLAAVRDLLARCLPARAVGRRAMRRVLALSLVIGLAVIMFGVGLAVAVRR